MIALHVAVLATTPGARTQSARAMAAVTVGFGAAMAIVHSGEGLTGTRFTFDDHHSVRGHRARSRTCDPTSSD